MSSTRRRGPRGGGAERRARWVGGGGGARGPKTQASAPEGCPAVWGGGCFTFGRYGPLVAGRRGRGEEGALHVLDPPEDLVGPPYRLQIGRHRLGRIVDQGVTGQHAVEVDLDGWHPGLAVRPA